MSGLLIDTKLITDIDAIADYFNKDSNKILRDLVAAELERIRPLLEAKKALNAANISHKNLEKQRLKGQHRFTTKRCCTRAIVALCGHSPQRLRKAVEFCRSIMPIK